MFRRGLKEGKIAREEEGYKSSIGHDVFTCRNTARVPNGCIRGGRVSKEEIARRNADKPVVSASKRYLHSLQIIRCDIPSLFGTTRLLYVLYTPMYIYSGLAMYLVNVGITDAVYRCVIRGRLTIIYM